MWKTWTELTSPDGRRSCASVWRLLGSQGFSGIYMFPLLDPSHCQRATHMTWGEVTELGDSRLMNSLWHPSTSTPSMNNLGSGMKV